MELQCFRDNTNEMQPVIQLQQNVLQLVNNTHSPTTPTKVAQNPQSSGCTTLDELGTPTTPNSQFEQHSRTLPEDPLMNIVKTKLNTIKQIPCKH